MSASGSRPDPADDDTSGAADGSDHDRSGAADPVRSELDGAAHRAGASDEPSHSPPSDDPDAPGGSPSGAGQVDGVAPLDAITEIEAEAEAEGSALDITAYATVHHDTIGSGPPPNHRAGRQRFLVAYLRVALGLVLIVGLIELVVPADRREQAGTLLVGLLVAAPLGRVVWLMVRWLQRGDWRFALVGAVLLAVVATGFFAR